MRLLRQAGMLRRNARPDRSLVQELLHGGGERLACPECGTPGLVAVPLRDEGDWQDAPTCEICGKPLAPERLEAMPDATRCVTCQQDAESGALAREAEYCPKCGAPLVLRVSRSAGITRYKMFCTGTPACRM